MKTKVAIIGSGNIGTDLMIKILRNSEILEVAAFVGIDPESDGLARAKKMGVPITDQGIDGLVAMPDFKDMEILFDATSAKAHAIHDKVAREHGKTIIDMTPAAIGPYVVPVVNLDEHLDAPFGRDTGVARTGPVGPGCEVLFNADHQTLRSDFG